MNKTNIRLIGLLILAIALNFVARRLHSLPILMVGAIVTFAGLAWFLFNLSTALGAAGWIGRTRREVNRITEGKSDAVIAEYRPRYEQGDQSPQTILTLLIAYLHIGQTEEAARFATNAHAIMENEQVCEKKDLSSRYLCYIIRLGLADMAAVEGRFAEAGRDLVDFLPHSVNKPYVATAAALLFFLADDLPNTRAMLEKAPHPGKRSRNAHSGGPRYRLITAYIRHKVLEEDTRAIMRRYRGEIAYWRDEAARSGGELYSQRMNAILDEIETLIA